MLHRVEQSVYALLRTRDMAVSRYKEFGIPVDWLSDSGVVGKVFSLFFLYLLLHNICLSLEKCYVSFVTQIKLSSVQLARKYMKRVAYELDSVSGSDKDPNREFLLLQGVRFAFRVHQVIKETLESNKKIRII